MILFQKNDSKFRALQLALSKLGVSSSAVSGSPIKAPIILIKLIFKRKKPNVYVFRYLNDYSSLLKSFMRLVGEISLVLICKLFKIRIWWLCHNIDNETHSYYKKLTSFRRYLIKKNSELIFTTHHLLIPHAEIILRKKNIHHITLGYLNETVYDNLLEDNIIEKKLISWIEERTGINARFIFVVGSVADKVLHFKYINSLVDLLNQNDNNNTWYAIVVGEKVQQHNMIFNIPSKYLLSKNIIKKYIDFYYRVISDLSISYTLFEASILEKPILTEKIGFLPNIIEYYKLGFIIDRNNIQPFLDEINSDKKMDYNSFLKNNNWEISAQILKKHLYVSI